MPIRNVIINSTDVQRSVDFYTRFLEAEVVGEPTAGGALLDLVTATLELRAVAASDSSWIPDDLQLGFRHVGFKVERVDPRADALKSADVPFHLDPLDAEGGVRICFFYDPDGTLLELVEGDLQYASVRDADGVAAERALGVPARPRFDHVALTVHDRAATDEFYRPLGFSFIGTIEQPNDPRGFSIGYLKSGDTVLEVFTYEAAKQDREPQLDGPGFGYVQLVGDAPSGATPIAATSASGEQLLADPNGFLFAVSAVGLGGSAA
jgi:catechol 2,3-dioxygenase-like lactoylglutathione lyase family enzyme